MEVSTKSPEGKIDLHSNGERSKEPEDLSVDAHIDEPESPEELRVEPALWMKIAADH